MDKSEDDVWENLRAHNAFFKQLEQLGSFSLPKDVDERILQPMRICHLAARNETIAPRGEWPRWQGLYGRLDEVRLCLGAAHYHLGNVRDIEQQIGGLVDRYRALFVNRSANIYAGVTAKLTYEYHAFSFALGRISVYLSFSCGLLFKAKCPNLKSLERRLRRSSAAGAAELLVLLQEHAPMLQRLVSHDGLRSIRDSIAHEGFLHAGSLHIGDAGARLHGPLEPQVTHLDTKRIEKYQLARIMEGHLGQVQEFVLGVVDVVAERVLPRVMGMNC